MTGISHHTNSIIDSPEARYWKYKNTSERFRIIQFGIVTWRFLNEQKTKLESKPYNLYIFPSEDGLINGEVGAIIFNKDHGLDFNKWIYEGIDYINEKQYHSMYQNVIENNINCYDPNNIGKYKNSIPHKEEDLEKAKEIIKEIKQFYLSKNTEYVIENIPKFMLYYIQNHLTNEMRQDLYFSMNTLNNKQVYYIIKVDKEKRSELLTKEIEKNLKELDKAKGVKQIYDALIKKKAMIIGHNMSLDLVFVISHFGDLPLSYKQFKSNINSYFNGIYDTKLMFEHLPRELLTGLNPELFSTLEKMHPYLRSLYNNQIEIIIPEGMTNYNITGSFHEAAYDAFITGLLFTWMSIAFKFNIQQFNYKIYFMRSIFFCFDLMNNEDYCIQNTIAYFLKSFRKASDIDLNKMFDANMSTKIKKIFSAESNNTIIILVEYENNNDQEQFEKIMSKYKNTFTVYSHEKYRELILQDENNKKMDNAGKYHKY